MLLLEDVRGVQILDLMRRASICMCGFVWLWFVLRLVVSFEGWSRGWSRVGSRGWGTSGREASREKGEGIDWKYKGWMANSYHDAGPDI